MPRLLPAQATDEVATHTLVRAFFQLFEGDWGEFDRGSIEVDELAARIARRAGLSVNEARRVIDAVPDELVPLPASVDLLERLHAAGHALFFLSNMPEPYARILEARHAFIARFRDGVFSSRVGLVKPEPAIYEHAVARFGVNRFDTLFVDDVPRNLCAAAAFGWRGIHFRDAAQCERELQGLGLL